MLMNPEAGVKPCVPPGCFDHQLARENISPYSGGVLTAIKMDPNHPLSPKAGNIKICEKPRYKFCLKNYCSLGRFLLSSLFYGFSIKNREQRLKKQHGP